MDGDPYLYENSNVLINKLNIRNYDVLQKAERNFTKMRMTIANVAITGDFNYNRLLETHRYIFQDIYSWAGVERTIPIVKREAVFGGDTVRYSYPDNIAKDATAAIRHLTSIEWSKLTLGEMAQKISEHTAALWQSHPFRDGNTRTIITFVQQFLYSQEIELDVSLFAENAKYVRDALVKASDGPYSDYKYLAKIFEDAIEINDEDRSNAEEMSTENNSQSRKTIYVCSPLAGEIEENIRKARAYSKFVAMQGATPIAPHITQIFDDEIPEERTLGLSLGIDYLRKADELWVFGDRVSSGMANEIKIAQEELHIPIYHVNEQTYDKMPFERWTTNEKKEVNTVAEKKTNVNQEQILMAREVDLFGYLEAHGYTLKHHGDGLYKLVEDGHDSIVIYPKTNSWYDFKNSIGGSPISFLVEHEGKPFIEATQELLGIAKNPQNMYISRRNEARLEDSRKMELPPADNDNKRVFAYLIKTRGIDRDIVKQCIDNGQIYQGKNELSNEKGSFSFSNCVFVGKDENGNPSYASSRSMNTQGSTYKCDITGSKKEYGFCLESSKDSKWVNVCEAPIDVLSFATLRKLNKEQSDYGHILSLGGVSDKALDKFLEKHTEVKNINICLDNDDAGRAAGEKIKQKYQPQGYTVFESYPHEKDYNDELKAAISKSQEISSDFPPASSDNKASFIHLTVNKHIDKDLVNLYIKSGAIYQTEHTVSNEKGSFVIKDTVFSNVDANGIPTYAISISYNKDIERPDFKVEYSGENKADNYISSLGRNSRLLIFNNPISMLTQQTVEKISNKDASHCLCCLSDSSNAISNYLEKNPDIKEIKVCLDKTISYSNENGQQSDYREKTFNKLHRDFTPKGIKVKKRYPEGLSLNQDYVKALNNKGRDRTNDNQRSSVSEKDDFELEK